VKEYRVGFEDYVEARDPAAKVTTLKRLEPIPPSRFGQLAMSQEVGSY
jgi:hypothetical protein